MEKSKNQDFQILFGNNVRKYRLQKNLSQEELAFRSDVHRNYLSDVERGTRNISIQAMGQIANGLNLELYKLLQEDS